MNTTITAEKLEHYFRITGEALTMAKAHINDERRRAAEECLDMAQRYYHDASHFKSKDDWVDAFAALSYAHGWLDCGARNGFFDVTDNRLFTV
ncbi:MAG: DUF357 domain-containing protein [Nanoarchaeota archaeon]